MIWGAPGIGKSRIIKSIVNEDNIDNVIVRSNKNMTPSELKTYLKQIIERKIKIAIMIWGAPGIGKSGIAKQIADELGIGFKDLRLSQIAPTDLRGLPVPDLDNDVFRYLRPDFLPTEGRGILLVDEINMAPPVMQGIAHQLVLDRRVGSYVVPEGWYIIAAGNRLEDRAAVFEMPSALANRFIHLQVEAEFDSFQAYAIEKQIHEHIIGFLSSCSQLLHRLDFQQPAWPSPRTWEMASVLHSNDLDIAPAVGEAAAGDFRAYLLIYDRLPDINSILTGNGSAIAFPEDPSVRYAITTALFVRATDVDQAYNAFRWLNDKATAEWVSLFACGMIPKMRQLGQLGALATLVQRDNELQQFLKNYRDLLGF